MRRRALLLGAAALPAACATAPETFAPHGPPFAPEAFFAGHLRSAGLFADRLGRVRSWFTAELRGAWDGGTLTFDETFTYEDGWTDRRRWALRRAGPGRWSGTATDAVGPVTAEEAGNAFHLRHTLDLPLRGGGTRRLGFDQWFVRVAPDQALSRAAVRLVLPVGAVGVGTAQVAFRRVGEVVRDRAAS